MIKIKRRMKALKGELARERRKIKAPPIIAPI